MICYPSKKKVRPIKRGDLQSPYPIDMPATAWGLGIANPQSIKRLGHFLMADNISAGTPNGGRHIRRSRFNLTAALYFLNNHPYISLNNVPNKDY